MLYGALTSCWDIPVRTFACLRVIKSIIGNSFKLVNKVSVATIFREWAKERDHVHGEDNNTILIFMKGHII